MAGRAKQRTRVKGMGAMKQKDEMMMRMSAGEGPPTPSGTRAARKAKKRKGK